MNGTSTPTGSRRPSDTLLRPIPNGSFRRVSGGLENNPNGYTNGAFNNDSPRPDVPSPSDDGGQWSSAIGHATTAGKSGRVIERLMKENDRLKREFELQTLRSQELERSLQTIRPQLEHVRNENDTLKHAKSIDETLLTRRDRKIEELKQELLNERSRREASEATARRYEHENEEVQETSRREVQRAQDEGKRASAHATILEQSHRQLKSEYGQRLEILRKDFAAMQAKWTADQEKFARLELVSEQMRTELEQARTLQSEMQESYQKYRDATEAWKNGLQGMATEENDRSRKLSQDMETVTRQMKWVMGMEKARSEV